MYQAFNGFDPAKIGYRFAYREGEINHCPGCGQSNWMIGRMIAECAFCNTAVPLRSAGHFGPGLFRHGGEASHSLAA